MKVRYFEYHMYTTRSDAQLADHVKKLKDQSGVVFFKLMTEYDDHTSYLLGIAEDYWHRWGNVTKEEYLEQEIP